MSLKHQIKYFQYLLKLFKTIYYNKITVKNIVILSFNLILYNKYANYFGRRIKLETLSIFSASSYFFKLIDELS
jgi:hypothetical protein